MASLSNAEIFFGARSPDDYGEPIGRAGRGSQGRYFLPKKSLKAFAIQQRFGHLKKRSLVRRTAAFGHEQEPVGRSVFAFGGRFDVYLSRKVRAGIEFIEETRGPQPAMTAG